MKIKLTGEGWDAEYPKRNGLRQGQEVEVTLQTSDGDWHFSYGGNAWYADGDSESIWSAEPVVEPERIRLTGDYWDLGSNPAEVGTVVDDARPEPDGKGWTFDYNDRTWWASPEPENPWAAVVEPLEKPEPAGLPKIPETAFETEPAQLIERSETIRVNYPTKRGPFGATMDITIPASVRENRVDILRYFCDQLNDEANRVAEEDEW